MCSLIDGPTNDGGSGGETLSCHWSLPETSQCQYHDPHTLQEGVEALSCLSRVLTDLADLLSHHDKAKENA